MGSSRFPGKVLAPLGGGPVIETVLDRIWAKVPILSAQVVLCTTWEHVDNPLSDFVESLGYQVYRGPTRNVASRFQGALRKFPCERFFRVCGDSPLLDPDLFQRLLDVPGDPDLVTNVFPRSFPKGQSLELIRSDTFLGLNAGGMPGRSLTMEQCEHPTRFYYDHPNEHSIVNVENTGPLGPDVAIDTVEDLHRIEKLL